MLRRSYVLPWSGTLPGAAHPKTFGSIVQRRSQRSQEPTGCKLWRQPVATLCVRCDDTCPLHPTCSSMWCRTAVVDGCKTRGRSRELRSLVPPGSQAFASQCSLHNAPIFRLLLKVAVNGTHQCESLNFCGASCPNVPCKLPKHSHDALRTAGPGAKDHGR